MKNEPTVRQQRSRREFVRESSALAAAAVVTPLAVSQSAHAAGSDVIRIGLIGCGGRGSGAAVNAMNAGEEIRLVAMGDLFRDNAQKSRKSLTEVKPKQVMVDDDHLFDGFDAYQKVIASDVDVVLIAAASRFHPQFLKAAIDAGKHVFIEKPHSVDVPGLSVVQAACDDAKKKGLAVVSGLCWRYDPGVRETIARVRDGAIGDIIAIEETYLRGPYRLTERDPEWTELEWQLRNWYHFCWLAGDDTLQSLIHNLDKAAWVLGDQPPASAFGIGGRASIVEPTHGDQFDHVSVGLEYDSGVRVYAFNRAQPGCFGQTADRILGTKGIAHMPQRCHIEVGGQTTWRYEGPKASMYDVEHQELFDSIRSGAPINNSLYMIRSTMLAIMARTAAYTGDKITWDDTLQSTEVLGPEELCWETEPPVKPGPDGLYPAPIPGFTRFT